MDIKKFKKIIIKFNNIKIIFTLNIFNIYVLTSFLTNKIIIILIICLYLF